MKPNTTPNTTPKTRLAGITQVLLKFYFTNPENIPDGIRREDRDEAKINEGHVQRAATSKIGPAAAQVGRVRFGARDNGVPWANNVQSVAGARCIHPMLVSEGFVIADVHYYYQVPRPKPGVRKPSFPKWVVVLTYGLDAEKNVLVNPANLPEGSPERAAAALVAKQLTSLMGRSWGYMHGWNNVDGGAPTITLNFNHDEGSRSADHAVILRDETMEVVPLADAELALEEMRAAQNRAAECHEEEAEPVAA